MTIKIDGTAATPTELEGLRSDLGVGERNEANGFAGLDASGDLVGTIIPRQDTAANIDAITLAEGELATTSDTNEIRVGDGVTAGGVFIAGRKTFSSEESFSFISTNANTTIKTVAVTAGITYKLSAVVSISTPVPGANQSDFLFNFRPRGAWSINAQTKRTSSDSLSGVLVTGSTTQDESRVFVSHIVADHGVTSDCVFECVFTADTTGNVSFSAIQNPYSSAFGAGVAFTLLERLA